MAADLDPRDVLDLYPPHRDTIPSLLASRRAAGPDRPALLFEGRSWSYAEIDAASDALARALVVRGVGRGDRIGLVSLNGDVALLVFLAAAKVGALFVPMNPGLADGELAYVLGHCRPTVVASQAEDLERVERITGAFAEVPWLLPLDEIGAAAGDVAGVVARIEQYAGPNGAVHLAEVGPDDPAVVIYTSGTTGFPKGVVHSHRNYVWAGEAFVERMRLQPDDRLLTVLPFFHVNALFYSWGGALAAGAAMVTTRRFSASRFWTLAAETGATVFNVLAALGNILAKRPRGEFDPGHRIAKIYGGPISAEMIRVFQEDFHVPTLIEGYGMSEIPGACNNPFAGPHKVGSIGTAARHPRFDGTFVELRVVDDEGGDVPVGAMGELLVKTPIMALHYLDDPEQTRAAMRDGWFVTGDYVRRDADGYHYFVARKRDIIRRRGENISGAELDRILSEHPGILEAATIGVPAELGDEEIMAVLVPRAEPPSAEEVLDWCRGRMAAMKIPRFVVFVDALPHTSSHRVEKYRLKQDPSLLARAFDRERSVSAAPT
ncbi:class I adenylate-forming enzyme family protein [Azospirillum sp. ST 5-10]|uniref:class I adenylate-forming enzyme family protein n=1 Tax=unclassified Azospirillum TaxID=2630922 RepID=UPI003F4A2059